VQAALTGNAVSGILPSASAAGVALQFEMLCAAGPDPDSAAGPDPDSTVSGLAAISLINVAALLAPPVLAIQSA
jgi:hypothetical protein